MAAPAAVLAVKAIFYSLFFGADQPRMNDGDYRKFADCFVTYEERKDEDGETYREKPAGG